MAIIPIDTSHVTLMLQNDAQQWRTTISWAKERYQAYNQNLSQATMSSLGIATADQNAILAFIGDLNRFIQLSQGTLPSNADDMVYNLQSVLGIM